MGRSRPWPFSPPRFLTFPDDAAYDEARSAWNLVAVQRPAAVARPETAEDIVAAVRHARANGLAVTAQGTGHGALSLGDLTDTVLTAPTACTAWRSTRATASRASRPARSGRTSSPRRRGRPRLPARLGPDVGVVGYTLGGGLSFYGRRYGTAASRLLAAELVLADGELVRARPAWRSRAGCWPCRMSSSSPSWPAQSSASVA